MRSLPRFPPAVAALLLGAVLASAACSAKQRVRTEKALAEFLISEEQSMRIGMAVSAELDEQGVRYVRDPAVVAYVDGIAGRVIGIARRDRPGVEYRVRVIDDPDTVNAFATPGGFLYVYTGLLLAADNEAEVAGVLAHEAGHVVGRHVERQMVNAYGLQALASLAVGRNPSLAQELAAGIASTGIMRAHGRSEEIEADEYGARCVSRAGYDPRAMITFFGKLAAREKRQPGLLAWLGTHPAGRVRIENLERFVGRKGLNGDRLGEQAHREIRARLGGRS